MLIIQKNSKFKIINIMEVDNTTLINIVKNNLLDDFMLIIDKIDVNTMIVLDEEGLKSHYEDNNMDRICIRYNGYFHGSVPLIGYSILMERLEIVKLLLAKGADVNTIYNLELRIVKEYNITGYVQYYNTMKMLDMINDIELYKLIIHIIDKNSIGHHICMGHSPYKLYMYSNIFDEVVGDNYEKLLYREHPVGNFYTTYINPSLYDIIYEENMPYSSKMINALDPNYILNILQKHLSVMTIQKLLYQGYDITQIKKYLIGSDSQYIQVVYNYINNNTSLQGRCLIINKLYNGNSHNIPISIINSICQDDSVKFKIDEIDKRLNDLRKYINK